MAPEVETQGAGETTRRGFFALAGALAAAVGTLLLGIPVVGEFVGVSFKRTKREAFNPVGAVAGLPLGQPVRLSFLDNTQDAYIREALPRDVFAVKRSASDVVVFSPICPHLGCHYNWNPATRHFECPCHGSVWSVDGTRIAGPTPRALDTLPAKIERGVLMVEWEQFQIGVPEKIAV